MKLGKVGVAVDQRKVLDGDPPFFIFDLNEAIVYHQNLAEVRFNGPSVLRSGRHQIGTRAWIEADFRDLVLIAGDNA